MPDFELLALTFPLFFFVISVRMTITIIIMYGRIKTEKHRSWRKVSGATALTPDEFVLRIQNICLLKKWNLEEISVRHATIRVYPSFWHNYGRYYYVEFDAEEKNIINVFYRDGFRDFWEYQPPALNLLNQLYKA